ncbi:hypothetical protein SpCBS45565_g04211 [Spizellomyces sp. 'palustris']|nr:hypothetical protein SpCBS45565_g04211 [Spizellomyces sp. 'palustris']
MRKKTHWRKTPNPSKLAPHEAEQDVFLSDEDMGLLEEYGSFTSFLTNLNPEELTRNEVLEGPDAIMRAKGTFRISTGDSDSDIDEQDHSDVEASYEQRPRPLKRDWKEEGKTRLPVRGEDGQLRAQQVVVIEESGMKLDDEDSDEEEEDLPPVAKKERVEKSKATKDLSSDSQPEAQPKSRAGRLVEAQEKLAEIASTIIEDPEKNIAHLKNLRQIGGDKDVQIKKLALLTQLAVYKDIIPGYRIRQLTEEEQTMKVSKDVKRLRQYEETLIANYQAYLQILENTVQASLKSSDSDKSLLVIAIQCMADLLTSVTHFNFRLNLLTAVVARMTLKNPPEVAVVCCNALCTLFDNDESGEVSLEAVKLIAKAIKAKHFIVQEEVLKTFLHLRLNQDLAAGNDRPVEKERGNKDRASNKRKSTEKHVSRKKRKIEKHDKEIEKEFKEAEAVYDREEVKKRHTETLKFVFLTYFRILKNAQASPLLPAVLEGLARYIDEAVVGIHRPVANRPLFRFAHLINVEFFSDLLNVLKKISFEQYQQYLAGDGVSAKDTRSAFHCVIAAFQLLSGQGEALNLDLKDFYNSMYTQLMRLPMNPEAALAVAGTQAMAERRAQQAKSSKIVHIENKSGSEIELALHGFELLFYKKRQVPAERVAAFVKRLAIAALHLPANAVLACLAIIRSLIIRFPRLESLLDAEGRLGTGIYQPMLDDPELSNPFATNLWEMTLFTQHYHPTVSSLAKHVASTIAITQKGTAQVTNVHKPLPSNLALPPRDFLTAFDPQPAMGGKPRFHLVPATAVPASIASILKKKKERGIKYADGPAVVLESSFMEGLRTSMATTDDNNVSLANSFREIREVGELKELGAVATRLRIMVELIKEHAAMADENSDDSGEEPCSEEESTDRHFKAPPAPQQVKKRRKDIGGTKGRPGGGWVVKDVTAGKYINVLHPSSGDLGTLTTNDLTPVIDLRHDFATVLYPPRILRPIFASNSLLALFHRGSMKKFTNGLNIP